MESPCRFLFGKFMSRSIESEVNILNRDPLPPEASERQLNRAFRAYQDMRYQGFTEIGGRVYRRIDLGLVTWPDGDKLRSRSVHSARGGNRNGRH